MLFGVVQDIPGRLRLRCGRGLMGQSQAAGIAQMLGAIDGVQKARVAPANGSVLVLYRPGQTKVRDAAIDAVAALDVLALDEMAPDEAALARSPGDAGIDVAAEDNRFAMQLVSMAAGRAIRHFLLPPQVRMVLTVAQAATYVAKGVRCLAGGRLGVEVLDATAIGASILQGNFDSAASVMFLLSVSDALQNHVNARTRIALEESLLNRAETVWLVDEQGRDVEVQLSQVECGQMVRVRTGQTLAIDGTVVSGDAHVNEASMTGEAAPVHKHEGSTVFAGTAVEEGSLVVRVDALPGFSRIDQIVRLVEDSSELKASAHSRAEHLSDALVPFSFAGFFAVLAVTRNITKATSVLMVDYSCAIKLSTPVAVMSAMREASARGAVVKGGKYLEALADADVIVFDKTGTLTQAAPRLEGVVTFGSMTKRQVLTMAACLEEHFPHSIARAIVQAAKDKGYRHEDEHHSEVDYIVAHGIASSVDGKPVRLGSAHFVFEDEGIPRPRGLDKRLKKEAAASSTVFLAVDGKLEGVLCIADPLRPEAAQVLSQLRALGVRKQVMLTGDAQTSAQAVADQLGLDDFHAQVLPEDKSRFVEELKRQGHTVAMVGDGINDSPALAAADVSIALNDASDIARAVADVSVMGASLDSLVMLRKLSSSLMARIQGDYRFIVAFNTALIGLGVSGVLAPTVGAYLHNISTVAVAAANTRPLLPAAKGD